jgi:uncharacterized membrane protein
MRIARRVKKTEEKTIIKLNPHIYYPLWLSGALIYLMALFTTVPIPWPIVGYGAFMMTLPLFRIEPDRKDVSFKER